MSAPRNRLAFETARIDREAIRALLAARRQDEPLLSAKAIARALGWPSTREWTVRWHLRAIRSGAAIGAEAVRE